MSPILRRLGRTLRRDHGAGPVFAGVRDVLRAYGQQISRDGLATDVERALLTARATPAPQQREQLDRIDHSLRLHDHVITTDLADDVARALLVGQGHAARSRAQHDELEAELIAIDEALAKAGATPAVDRVDAIRALSAHHGAPDILDELHDILREAVDELPELAHHEQAARQHWEPSTGAYPADPISSSRTLLADRCANAADRLRGALPARGTGPWCSADLDGARCARPADHAEPCRPAEPVPVVRRPATGDVAQCDAHPFGVRCALVAGHPGTHTSAGLV